MGKPPRRVVAGVNFHILAEAHIRPNHKGGGVNDEQSEQVALHEFTGGTVVKQLLRIPWNGVQLRPTAGQDTFRDEVIERDVLCVAERRRWAVLSGQHNWHFIVSFPEGQRPLFFNGISKCRLFLLFKNNFSIVAVR